MKNKIKLKSRDGTESYLVKNSENTYLLKSESPYLRVSGDAGDYIFIDPCGGPLIMVGYTIEDKKVKKISFEEGKGYLVTFE